MIDYEKLKLAHKLSKNLSFIDWYIKDVFGKPDNYIVLAYEDEDGMLHAYEFKHDEIDGLITKLSELTAPKPKYGIRQKVWRLNDEYLPQSLLIEEIDYESDLMYMDEHGNWWIEEQLYRTKEALIQAQIDYWVSLKYEENESQELRPKEQLKKVICCGKELKYVETAWSTAKCHLCGKKLQESCQHESDGELYLSYPPKNNCKKCGEFY